MLPSQHVFSHQYPQTEPSWLHQQQGHHRQQQPHPTAHQHAQAQAQAAQVAHQQHFNRIAASGPNNNPSAMNPEHHPTQGSMDVTFNEENRRVLGWVAELMNGSSRETALMELSKKREQVPELALIIWHSFGGFIFGLKHCID